MEQKKPEHLSSKPFALGLFLFSVFMYYFSFGWKASNYTVPFAEIHTFPRIVAYGIALFSIILFVRAVAEDKKAYAAGAEKYNLFRQLYEDRLVYLLLAVTCFYIFLIPRLGFLSSTFVFTALASLLLGKGRVKWWVTFVVAFGLCAVSYLFFCVLLKVVMPTGILI